MWIYAGCIVTQLSALGVLFLTVRVDLVREEKSLKKNETVDEDDLRTTAPITTTTPPYRDMTTSTPTTERDEANLDENELGVDLYEVELMKLYYNTAMQNYDEIVKTLDDAVESVRNSYTLYKYFVEPLLKFHNSLMFTFTAFALVYCCLLSMGFIYGLFMRDEVILDMYMNTSYWIMAYISSFVVLQLIFHPSPYQAGTIAVLILHGVCLWFARILIANIKRRNELRLKRKHGKLPEEKSFVTNEIKI